MVRRGLKGKKQNLKSGEGFAGEDEGFGFDFTDDDIISIHVQHSASALFLDRYSESDMRQDLEDLGILKKLRQRGHHDVSIEFDLSDPFVQKMTWRCAKASGEKPPASSKGEDDDDDTLLCDCVIRVLRSVSLLKAVRPSPEDPPETREGADLISTWAARLEAEDPDGPIKLCVVEWLLLQDPLAPPGTRRLLPGQKLPGLGIQRDFGRLLWKWCADCSFDAIVNRPLYLHNAVMYADASTTFLNPHAEDCFRALCRDLVSQLGVAIGAKLAAPQGNGKEGGMGSESETEGTQVMSLGDISHAVNCGALQLTQPKGQVVKWSAQEQISGFSRRAKAFLGGKEYMAACVRLWGVAHTPHLEDIRHLIHPNSQVTVSPYEDKGPLDLKTGGDSEGEGQTEGVVVSPELYTLETSADFDDTRDIEILLNNAPPWHAVPLQSS